ncbi:STAS domain-containing protein [Megalodesulfovibrio paquesii]
MKRLGILSGELDVHMECCLVLEESVVAAAVPMLRQRISQALESGTTQLVLDMRQVRDLDSIGLSMLIGVAVALRQADGGLMLRNVQDDVFNILHSMRLDQHILVQRLQASSNAVDAAAAAMDADLL